MASIQGDLALLETETAQKLLGAAIPARLAYNWTDGTPRVVPMWFHWNGQEIVLAGPADAPKLDAIRAHPQVALTIDGTDWPYKVLLIRGSAAINVVDGLAPEYTASAYRYFGAENGQAFLDMAGGLMSEQARIVVAPAWVGLLDFETRFPQALANKMG